MEINSTGFYKELELVVEGELKDDSLIVGLSNRVVVTHLLIWR